MKFFMPAPNTNNLQLYEIVDPTTNIRILADPSQPYVGWYNPVDFEVYLQFHEPTVRVLEETYLSSWRHDMRKKVRSQIRKVFVGHYRQHTYTTFLEGFQKFWSEYPAYPGEYQGYTAQDLEWKFVDDPNHPGEVVRVPFPVETAERIKAQQTQQLHQENMLDRYLSLIAEWAMASYSQCRDEWVYLPSGAPLDINSFEEAVIHDKHTVSPMLRKLRQITSRLEREGKIDPLVREILG